MEAGRQEILFPFGGLDDSEAKSDQPNGTTTEAVNVRPFDPTTGQRRGAQRSGTKKFSTAQVSGSERVQSILAVPYDEPRLTYSLLGTPTSVWTAINPAKGTAFAITTDSDGFIYAYDGTSSVVKYNQDGTLLNTLFMPTYVGEGTTRRVLLDEFGNVYAGITSGSGGLIQKWKRTEDDTYERSWAVDILGSLRDMTVVNDLLYVALDTGPYLDIASDSEIHVYAGLLSDYSPTRVWEKVIPHPVHGLSVTGAGKIYFTSAPNPERLRSDAGGGSTYNESQVDWTPFRMTNAASRLHHWMDVSYFQEQGLNIQHENYLNNHIIPSITSRADAPYVDAAVSAHDTSERPMISPGLTQFVAKQSFAGTRTNQYERSGPQFLANAWGARPTLRFSQRGPLQQALDLPVQEPGTVLISNYNRYNGASFNDVKLNAEDALEQNRSPIPSAEDAKYIFAICGRVNFEDSPARSIVFSITDRGEADNSTESHSLITMMVNADQSGDGSGHEVDEGKVTLFIKGAKFTNNAESTTPEEDWRPYDLEGLDSDGRFILAIVMDPSGARKGSVRLNGRSIDSFTVTDSTKFLFEGKGRDDTINSAADENLTAGRLILGGPTVGHNWTLGDCNSAADTASSATIYPWVERTAWYDDTNEGQPPWTSPRDHSSFGGNAAGTTTPAYVVGNKCGHFCGEISETITMLADSTGGLFNNDSAGLVPYKATTTFTAERDRTSTNSTSGSTDVEDLEGYLAWKWGISVLLPTGTTDVDGLRDGHPWASAPPSSTSVTVIGHDNSAYTNAILSSDAIVGKLAPNGDGQWAINGGGMGYGITANEDGDVYTVGPTIDGSSNPSTGVAEPIVQARKIIDQGASASTDQSDGAWAVDREQLTDELSAEEGARYPRLALDEDDNLYWPIAATSKANHVRRLAAEDGTKDWQYSTSSQTQTFGVATPPKQPTYRDDDITGPEFLYIASDNGEQDGTTDLTLPQIHKIRLVTAEQNIEDGTSARSVKLIAVAGGDVVDITTTAATAISGGTDALLTDGRFVSATAAYQKGYFTDGVNYKVFDPRALPASVSDWVATKGEIPPRAKLVTFWRGRMVLARDPEDPQDWHMSALGEPDDWDSNPSVFTATMSISGNNSRGGRVPDVVNALIPYNDDMLIFGCDSNMYRLTGDPMAGGQMDSISDVTGVAYGDAWCRDPEGLLYFYGSRGGVYALTPQGQVTSISNKTVERRLQEVDLERYRVRLVWNDLEQGLHVFLTPNFYDGVVLKMWYWDRRHAAWFEDEMTDASKQFTTGTIMDGDAFDDRVLVFGTEDGYIRRWDRDTTSDDGDRIDSRVLFGPFVDEAMLAEARFGKLSVELASNQSGAEYDLFVGRSSDVQGDAVRSGTLRAGPNPYPGGMFKGANAWIRLKNGVAAERWALEVMSLSAYPAGRKRVL